MGEREARPGMQGKERLVRVIARGRKKLDRMHREREDWLESSHGGERSSIEVAWVQAWRRPIGHATSMWKADQSCRG